MTFIIMFLAVFLLFLLAVFENLIESWIKRTAEAAALAAFLYSFVQIVMQMAYGIKINGTSIGTNTTIRDRKKSDDALSVLSRLTEVEHAIKIIMAAFITIIILICALFVMLTDDHNDAQQKWASGAIGTVIGYWLKGHGR